MRKPAMRSVESLQSQGERTHYTQSEWPDQSDQAKSYVRKLKRRAGTCTNGAQEESRWMGFVSGHKKKTYDLINECENILLYMILNLWK